MGGMFAGSLDTNILLRYLLEDGSAQGQAATRLIESSRIWHVSTLAIAETVFVLQDKGLTRHEIKKDIEALASYHNLYFDKSTVLAATELYANKPSLSFVDAYLAYETSTLKTEPLYTFDRKLARQAPQTRLAG